MAATEIKTIKPTGGGDYTSLNAWDAAERVNLVSADKIKVAELYSDGYAANATLTIDTGWTTDSTRYIIIRAATGHGHSGVFTTAKARIGWYDTNIYKDYTRFGYGICFHSMSYGCVLQADNCIVEGMIGRAIVYGLVGIGNGRTGNLVKNCIGHNNGYLLAAGTGPGTTTVYNCTSYSTAALATWGGTIVSENNYLGVNPVTNNPYQNNGGSFTKGTHDASNNTTEVLTPALRGIAYSTANFNNVTLNSEDLRLPVASALLTQGTVLAEVTNDIKGTSRIGFPYDIGADQETDIPFCWNYTAKFKGSKKLFKTSGGGAFPRNLRVPDNVDKSTGRMIDDGKEIDPDHYEVF